ncbi:MAG: SDR family NAD(P)-dependent oxidoreductase [Bryobacteraceae bacterium]
MDKVTSYRAVYEQKEPYSDEEVKKIFAEALDLNGGTHGYAKHPKTFRLLLELMLETGMRVGDAIRYDPTLVVKGEHLNDVRDLVDKTVARYGRLDAAVNCAGTEGKPGPVTEQTAQTYAATFDTNVLGTLLSMKHEMRVMLVQGSGSIVNVSSTYGHIGAAGASIYSASSPCLKRSSWIFAADAAESRRTFPSFAPCDTLPRQPGG